MSDRSIRDPSDGSVRGSTPEGSALPPVHKPKSKDDVDRLDRSREWLKNYFHRKVNEPNSTDGAAA